MEMGRKRRTSTDKFKAKVAVAAITGMTALAELASSRSRAGFRLRTFNLKRSMSSRAQLKTRS
jgi:hypothetical protein